MHRQEAVKAERIVAEETLKFGGWLENMEVTPTIVDLGKADNICRAELEKTLRQLGPMSDEQRQALEVLTQSVTAKLLHDPIIFLKRNHHIKKPHKELSLVRRLFNLDREHNGGGSERTRAQALS